MALLCWGVLSQNLPCRSPSLALAEAGGGCPPQTPSFLTGWHQELAGRSGGGGGASEGPPAQHTGWPLANSPVSIPVSRTSEPGGGGGGILHTVPPPREAGDRD